MEPSLSMRKRVTCALAMGSETHALPKDVETTLRGYMVGVHLLHQKPTVTWPGSMYFFFFCFLPLSFTWPGSEVVLRTLFLGTWIGNLRVVTRTQQARPGWVCEGDGCAQTNITTFSVLLRSLSAMWHCLLIVPLVSNRAERDPRAHQLPWSGGRRRTVA